MKKRLSDFRKKHIDEVGTCVGIAAWTHTCLSSDEGAERFMDAVRSGLNHAKQFVQELQAGR